ncbi:DUF2306 domain-containing protein [Methylorubrum suomiense]|uniref:DUF2306 domain-containing protein n=2 Tax=Methylorubrum TaxID=2282523 RepID=A0ABQ4UR19_9HYPH|nr:MULTISPECIES: DUF2306 domain-containing protein [Methylobacteriaceae]GJE73838.1 hypothetical protein BGCPKDLD_0405 [Methylorubrum suomiense]
MTLTPLFEAGAIVMAHAGAALAALGLGSAQLFLPKGGARHRILGWGWVVLMGLAAASSFGIGGQQWSPIHLLSAAALIMLAVAIVHARARRIEAHRWTMIGLFVGALVITGLFTLVPGRVMHAVLFGT